MNGLSSVQGETSGRGTRSHHFGSTDSFGQIHDANQLNSAIGFGLSQLPFIAPLTDPICIYLSSVSTVAIYLPDPTCLKEQMCEIGRLSFCLHVTCNIIANKRACLRVRRRSKAVCCEWCCCPFGGHYCALLLSIPLPWVLL